MFVWAAIIVMMARALEHAHLERWPAEVRASIWPRTPNIVVLATTPVHLTVSAAEARAIASRGTLNARVPASIRTPIPTIAGFAAVPVNLMKFVILAHVDAPEAVEKMIVWMVKITTAMT